MRKVIVCVVTAILGFCILMLISRFVFRDNTTNIYVQAIIVGIISAALVFSAQRMIRKTTK